ncbi:hypothetical protein SAY87_026943 [Trapa incisa]|uniref:Uncharacterized protein n=1 Tax=Trapa incisa TaxID=236973 RepID=A0AAN7GVA2_9MYRT|nr:hypothetical protein SAY87_026943 [Trapa incisa]
MEVHAYFRIILGGEGRRLAYDPAYLPPFSIVRKASSTLVDSRTDVSTPTVAFHSTPNSFLANRARS